MLVGGSSGSVLSAAIRYAKEHGLNESHRVLCILPDSIRNYMTKFLSSDWMVTNGFMDWSYYKDES